MNIEGQLEWGCSTNYILACVSECESYALLMYTKMYVHSRNKGY